MDDLICIVCNCYCITCGDSVKIIFSLTLFIRVHLILKNDILPFKKLPGCVSGSGHRT